MSDKPTCGELEQKIRELEKELSKHQQVSALFESIFKAIPEATIYTDTNRRIVMSNPALTRIFGYSEEEVAGKHTEILYASKESYEEQGKIRFNLSAEEKLKPYEVSYRKKNGEIFPSETVGTVVKDNDGKTIGYLGIIRDISARKKAEIALSKAHNELGKKVEQRTNELKIEKDRAQNYLDIAGVIIVVLDANGNVSLINRKGAQILGYKEKEIEGKNWFNNFIPERERKEVKEGFSKIIAGDVEPLEYFENYIVTKNGEERLIAWHNSVIRDENNRIVNTLSSGNDITDQREAEIDLQKSSENIKRFAYSVSHDLKNPTIALHGLTRLLEKKYGEILDERGKAVCTQIINITEHVTLLVDNLNSLITTKEIPFSFENINLHESCNLIREEFAAQLNKRGISWSEPEVLPIVKADRLSILRVLRNFVDNALKYGGKKLSNIEIGYQHSENMHILSVSDNGKGFKEEGKENMFRVFSRNTTSGDVTGTGLGLAIVKEIAEKHGGNAWAESTPGHGATFYISISKDLN